MFESCKTRFNNQKMCNDSGLIAFKPQPQSELQSTTQLIHLSQTSQQNQYRQYIPTSPFLPTTLILIISYQLYLSPHQYQLRHPNITKSHNLKYIQNKHSLSIAFQVKDYCYHILKEYLQQFISVPPNIQKTDQNRELFVSAHNNC